MPEKHIYRTDNYHLACFLLGRGADFLGVEEKKHKPEDPEPNKNELEFLFTIPPSINLAKIMVWWCSKDADDIKSILTATKTVKRAISEFLSNEKKN